MLVAITGHESGLGKALYNVFDNTLGFDITNGYDINNYLQILDEADHCDVFINNAYSGFSQVNLLEELFNRWRNSNKIIVNISSVAPNYNTDYETFRLYPTHKLALDDACYRLQGISKSCKVINIKPHFIDTNMSKEFEGEKLDPLYVATEIKEIVLTKNNLTTVVINQKL